MALRQRLLDTPAERVPPTLAALVADFCRPIPEIRAAFVGLTEVRHDFERPVERLSVAFELSEPAAETAEGDRELRLVADRFYDAMPDDVQAGGCNFLEPGATAAWEAKAQKVYPAAPAAP
jgi:hypothetical protein